MSPFLQKNHFEWLHGIQNGYSTEYIRKKCNQGLSQAEQTLRSLKEEGFLDANNRIMQKAVNALAPYQVDNAVIMAAGMAQRFIPLSLEKPKGLIVVKGEVLVERQIRQLQMAGIRDITVVVGYKKEMFYYLKDKFGVDIVVNEDYWRYNNPSTLMLVADRLRNTYICSSDNYFVENVFDSHVYDSYYSAVFSVEKCEEYGIVCDNSGRITAINHQPENMWIMMGHAYFSKAFSQTFVKLLKKEYDSAKYDLWEKLLERHLDALKIDIRKYRAQTILEFDSLEELSAFDSAYISDNRCEILENIARVLHCKMQEVKDFSLMADSLTNDSFCFSVKGKRYVYRHPGEGTQTIINRKSEVFSLKKAKELGLDETVVEIDGEKGWKISSFIEGARCLDYHQREEVITALQMMRKLHDAKLHSPYEFNIIQRTLDLIEEYKYNLQPKESDFEKMLEKMKQLYMCIEKDGIYRCLCHCDCYKPNFLIGKNGKMTLIDWEYSGNDDPASDLGTFICCSDYSFEQALEVIALYYGKKPSDKQLRHALAYVAISSYYWYIWALYKKSIGEDIGDYLALWHRNTCFYHEKASELYAKQEEMDVHN